MYCMHMDALDNPAARSLWFSNDADLCALDPRFTSGQSGVLSTRLVKLLPVLEFSITNAIMEMEKMETIVFTVWQKLRLYN